MGLTIGGIGRFVANAAAPAADPLAARQQSKATARQQEIGSPADVTLNDSIHNGNSLR